jgi:four helix bundle protein
LARQLADASEGVALNLGEGRLRRDGDQRRHFEFAAGSASEVTVALRIAVAKGYVTAAEAAEAAEVDEVLDRVRAMLYHLTR